MTERDFVPTRRQLAHLLRVLDRQMLGHDLAVHGADDQLFAEAARFAHAQQIAAIRHGFNMRSVCN